MPDKSPSTSVETNAAFSRFKNPALSLISGFSSGLVVAFALNPWDKALYLSVIHQRQFIDIRNFHQPFQGVTQSLFQRAVSHGLYFPLEHFAHSVALNNANLGDNSSSIAAGTFAGAVNALILNPVAAVKYTTWNSNKHRSYINQLYSMYNKGGKQQFMKGMYATMTRDIIFGAIFAYLRHSRRRTYKTLNIDEERIPYTVNLWIDGSSAFIATVASSPFNFVRNIQYATAKNVTRIPSMVFVMRTLYIDGMNERNIINAMKYWLFRLRIGWGTARVAVGMSFTSFCYEMTQKIITNQ